MRRKKPLNDTVTVICEARSQQLPGEYERIIMKIVRQFSEKKKPVSDM